MTPSEHKTWNWLYWGFKGHLFPDESSVDIMKEVADSYFKRAWGNHEFGQRTEKFEDVYNERFGSDPKRLGERLPDHQRRSLRGQ